MPDLAEKKQGKRMRILDSAYDLFLRNSVHSTAIDDVVKAAGVAKGTFYLYFKDKYDLLDQLILQKSTAVLMDAYEASFAASAAALPEKLLGMLDCVIDQLRVNREFAALLQKNLSRCFLTYSQASDPTVQAALSDILEQMKAAGFTQTQAQRTLYLITDLTGSVCCDAIVRGQPFSLDEIRPTLQSAIRAILKEGSAAHG